MIHKNLESVGLLSDLNLRWPAEVAICVVAVTEGQLIDSSTFVVSASIVHKASYASPLSSVGINHENQPIKLADCVDA